MKRIYHPYWKWEDWKNGMFILKGINNEEELSRKAKKLLSNQKEFFDIAKKVIKDWKHSSEVNLSNKSRNRQAWIGQASCNYKYKIPEYITKYGWRLLNPTQQKRANLTADKIILTWEKRYNAKKILK